MKPQHLFLLTLVLLAASRSEAQSLSARTRSFGQQFLQDTVRCPDARTGSCFRVVDRFRQLAEGAAPDQALGWQVCLSNSMSYDTNPFLDSTQTADWHYDAELNLEHDLKSILGNSGFEGLIRGVWGTTIMDRYNQLDGQVFGVTSEISHQLNDHWEFDLFYDSRWAFDLHLNHMAQASHSPALGFQWRQDLNQKQTWETVCHFVGGYVWSHPAELSAARGSVACDLHYRDAGTSKDDAPQWWDVKLSAEINYYDFKADYHNWTAKVSLALERKLSENCTLSAAVSYTNNASTLIDGSQDYDAFVVMPSVALSYAF